MSLFRILLAACSLSLVATLANAQTPVENATHAPPPASSDTGGHGFRHFLSDNERMMLMVDMQTATKDMTDDQKHAYRQQQRERFMAMSDADRTKFKADLDTRWAALTPDQKTMITRNFQDFMARRQAGASGSGGQ